MKIFITGATGFIGSHLLKRLAQTKHELHCLVRRISPASEQLESLGATVVMGDVTDKESVLRGMRSSDWVFHLAGLYSFWEPNNRIFKAINVDGTRNVMECALETNVTKVVHVSTAAIYGKPADCPFTEESEVGPARFSEYSRTKYEGDLVVWDLHKNKSLPVVVVYPTAVLGPGDPKATGKYIVDLIQRRLPATVLDDAIMTFVHVKDVAEAIIRAAEKQNNIGEKYLVGKFQMSFREINQLVSEISGVPLPKLHLPDWVTMFNAVLLTGFANVIKKPPLWGMSKDQIKVMREGFRVDGSKAERELGISYTPIRVALEEAIVSYQR
jgi:dihydroflavonol-4-reductase